MFLISKIQPNKTHSFVLLCLSKLLKYDIMKYICTVCDYIYDPEMGDPESGIEPGTTFEDIPDDWVCPLCGVGKEDFDPYED